MLRTLIGETENSFSKEEQLFLRDNLPHFFFPKKYFIDGLAKNRKARESLITY
jgi:hypothetical protein